MNVDIGKVVSLNFYIFKGEGNQIFISSVYNELLGLLGVCRLGFCLHFRIHIYKHFQNGI